MLDEVFTALALAQRCPEQAAAVRQQLERLVASAVKSADAVETQLFMELIGFAGAAGLDPDPLVQALGKVMSAHLSSEPTPDAHARFRNFVGESAPKHSAPARTPPPGTVRLSAIAPPKRRWA